MFSVATLPSLDDTMGDKASSASLFHMGLGMI